MSRRAANSDTNQGDIVDALRARLGVVVRVLADQGDGIPDLLVGFRRRLYLLEVKNPDTENPAKPRAALTAAQVVFFDEWSSFPVFIVFTPQQALEAIGAT